MGSSVSLAFNKIGGTPQRHAQKPKARARISLKSSNILLTANKCRFGSKIGLEKG